MGDRTELPPGVAEKVLSSGDGWTLVVVSSEQASRVYLTMRDGSVDTSFNTRSEVSVRIESSEFGTFVGYKSRTAMGCLLEALHSFEEFLLDIGPTVASKHKDLLCLISDLEANPQ